MNTVNVPLARFSRKLMRSLFLICFLIVGVSINVSVSTAGSIEREAIERHIRQMYMGHERIARRTDGVILTVQNIKPSEILHIKRIIHRFTEITGLKIQPSRQAETVNLIVGYDDESHRLMRSSLFKPILMPSSWDDREFEIALDLYKDKNSNIFDRTFYNADGHIIKSAAVVLKRPEDDERNVPFELSFMKVMIRAFTGVSDSDAIAGSAMNRPDRLGKLEGEQTVDIAFISALYARDDWRKMEYNKAVETLLDDMMAILSK